MDELSELVADFLADLPEPEGLLSVVDFGHDLHWAPLGAAENWPDEVLEELELAGSGNVILRLPLENPFVQD